MPPKLQTIAARLLRLIAQIAVAPFALAFLAAVAACVYIYRLFRWAELVTLYKGDENQRARDEYYSS